MENKRAIERAIGGSIFPIPLTGREPPPGWQLVDTGGDGGAWINPAKKLTVIGSIGTEMDGKRWLHLSMSHSSRMPTYEELVYLKRHWAGDDAKCVMVLPGKSEHVNIHPRCLHLWSCLDGDVLPDFTRGSGSI